ncbi:MAG: glycosyltransferase [Candidatus Hydrogenedens sp.]|nr:glycosyltransferase [Candidatus Hydrogenedens sp.]
MTQHAIEERLPPVRGLVCGGNRRGGAFRLSALKQWVHLSKAGYKAEKIDILADGQPRGAVVELLEFAASENLPAAIRLSVAPEEEDLRAFAAAGATDLFYAPAQFRAQTLESLCAACTALGLPLRIQITRPLFEDSEFERVREMLWAEPIWSINLAPWDPFLPDRPCTRTETVRLLEQTASLAEAAVAHGKEVNLLRFPFCLLPRERWAEVLTLPQFYLHHQQYMYEAYDLAQTIHRCSVFGMAAAIEHQLSAGATHYHIIDKVAFPRIISHPSLHVRLWLKHKIVRQFARRTKRGAPLPDTEDAWEAALKEVRAEADRHLLPACRECALKHICDHGMPPLREVLRGAELTPQRAEGVVSPLHFNCGQLKRYDAVDEARRAETDDLEAIAVEARRVIDESTPTRVFGYDEYEIEGRWTDRLIGAVRWWSLTTDRYRSSELARVEPPFTLGFTVGGGMAEQAGFCLADHIYLLCPMIGPTHYIALHVRRDGSYVLLRDGQPVRPTEFTGLFRVPKRLGSVLHPRLCLWNIDGQIQTQSPQLWLNSEPQPDAAPPPVYSVIVPSTRYSRRLQALALGVAHQAGYDLSRIELIVSYVPGLDSNDDLLDSLEAAFPALRIVRCTFTERHVRSRGLMVNEAVRMASGEWVILFDSDIVVPPDFFARLDGVPEDTKFIAPDGRKMLPPAETAQILLGECRPWEDFQSFLDGPGELWHREADGVPVGFCQIVRRSILQELPYAQADHFEGSDWEFSQQVYAKYGKEHRLEGCYVLHLDHGGSQWYGARKQK